MSCKFLELPCELRLQIYFYLVVKPDFIETYDLLLNRNQHASTGRMYSHIMATNKQVYQESSLVFWSANIFDLSRFSFWALNGKKEPDFSAVLYRGSKPTVQEQELQKAAFRKQKAFFLQNVSKIRHFQVQLDTEMQKHPQLRENERCVHIRFDFQALIKEIVDKYFTGSLPPRTLHLVVDLNTDSQVQGRAWITNFDHSRLKKLNYRSENAPYGEGDTLDVVAGLVNKLLPPHRVTLRLDSLYMEGISGKRDSRESRDMQDMTTVLNEKCKPAMGAVNSSDRERNASANSGEWPTFKESQRIRTDSSYYL